MRLRTHDVRDAKPLLIAVAGLDHAQHEHGGADAQRSPARKIERSIAFGRIVDDNHEFRRMSRLVAAALLGHRLPRPPPDRILLRAVLRRATPFVKLKKYVGKLDHSYAPKAWGLHVFAVD